MQHLFSISKDRFVRRILFLLFAVQVSYGVYLGLNGILLGDAVSRTANAYYVLHVRPYRFASMGLVWNPLPSTLQLPFVALAKIWKPFVTQGIGASIISALFATWGASILISTFLKMKVKKAWAIILSLACMLNPYTFFYAANGMSEVISFNFTIMIICNMTLWMKNSEPKHLVAIAMGFVGLFLTRYESIPFAAAVAAGLALHILFSRKEQKYYATGKKLEAWRYLEGTAVLIFSPMAYAVAMWMLYNWVISGNPLYFLNSGYSMLAYSAYYTAYGGPLETLAFLWVRTWPFLIPVFAILMVRLFKGKLWRMDTLIFLLCSLVLTAFQYVMLLRGSSAGYVRYMCYPMLVAFAWLPYEISLYQDEKSSKTSKRIKAFFLAVLLALGGWFGTALANNEIYREDTLLMLPEGSTQTADYINARLGDKRILMDAYRAYYVFMNLNNPDQVVISSSEDFYESLADPAAYGIDYIMVPESGSYGDMDAVNIAYPTLYYEGAPWCVEEAAIGEFKIFRITDRVWEGDNGV